MVAVAVAVVVAVAVAVAVAFAFAFAVAFKLLLLLLLLLLPLLLLLLMLIWQYTIYFRCFRRTVQIDGKWCKVYKINGRWFRSKSERLNAEEAADAAVTENQVRNSSINHYTLLHNQSHSIKHNQSVNHQGIFQNNGDMQQQSMGRAKC